MAGELRRTLKCALAMLLEAAVSPAAVG